jgi:endonuclease YncB( thermonuclease family)
MRHEAQTARRRGAWRPGTRRPDSRALIGILILVAILGFYAYRSWIAPPAPLTGFAAVADGDSLDISERRVRLEGIDAPELDQMCTDAHGQPWACGQAATRELRAHVKGQKLRCEAKGLDRFQRVLAVCFLPDGSDLNAWMVHQGWAQTSGYAEPYLAEQDQAKAAKRGIWVGSFTPPREWRAQHPRQD